MSKKIISILVCVLMILGSFASVVACKKDNDKNKIHPDVEKVNSAYEWLTLREANDGDLNALTDANRLVLPVKKDEVAITWSVDKPAYVNLSSGRITQPDYDTGDQDVTLTATLKLNETSKEKQFTVKVLKKVRPQDEPFFLYNDFKQAKTTDISETDWIATQDPDNWAAVSGKSGSSIIKVVDSIPGITIPGGSKAVEVKYGTEKQAITSFRPNHDQIVIEVDVLQTRGGAPIRFQNQASGTGLQIGFGVDKTDIDDSKGKIYYRDYALSSEVTGAHIEFDKWYTLRAEIDLVAETLQLFYYEEVQGAEAQLVPVTPGEISFKAPGKTIDFKEIYLRTGSSSAKGVDPNPSYFTNLKANNIYAMPRPDETVVFLGNISGISDEYVLAQGETFTPDVPVVKNKYGSERTLVEGTDYTVAVSSVDTSVANTDELKKIIRGEAGTLNTVTYTITNKTNEADVKTVERNVIIYNPEEPNIIRSVTAPVVDAEVSLNAAITVKTLTNEGTLYYYATTSDVTEMDAATIKANGQSVELAGTSTVINTTIEEAEVGFKNKFWYVVDCGEKGESDVFSNTVEVVKIVTITTAQAFYDMTVNPAENTKYELGGDIDFTGFTWNAPSDPVAFNTTLDGKGYTVKNITITSTGGYAGIFTRLTNATIKNLALDNIQITATSATRAGILAGQATGTLVTLENISITNSSVAASQYAGALLGRVEDTNVTVVAKNIYINNVNIDVKTSSGKYSAGVVAYVEKGNLDISDVQVKADILTADRSGGIVARLGIASNLKVERAVIDVTANTNSHFGAVLGQVANGRTSTVNPEIKDTFVTGTVTITGSYRANSIIADLAGISKDDVVIGNNFEYNFTVDSIASRTSGLDGTLVEDAPDNAWWSTNLSSIASSELWTIADGMANLTRAWMNVGE